MARRSRTVAEIAASLAARRATQDARRAAGIAARRRVRQRAASRADRAERRRVEDHLTLMVASGLAQLVQLGGPGAVRRVLELAGVETA